MKFVAGHPLGDSNLEHSSAKMMASISTTFGTFNDKEWAEHIEKVRDSVGSFEQKRVSDAKDTIETNIDVSSYIDHTQLKLDATAAQIDQLCQEARNANFKVGRYLCVSVCTSCNILN